VKAAKIQSSGVTLTPACFKESADIKSRVGIFETVRDVKREALTLLWLYESEASLDGVCNQLKVFAAHNPSSLLSGTFKL
jgi:hypothetical protein